MNQHRFALFALGDRVYGPQFCAAGRKLAGRIVQLGAKPICAIGYGDDGTSDGGVFADLDIWLENTLLPLLPKKSDEPVGVTRGTEDRSVAYRISVKGCQLDQNLAAEEWTQESFRAKYEHFFAEFCPLTAYTYESQSDEKVPLLGSVVSNARITASSWEQNTRHVHIEVKGLGQRKSDSRAYRAGDVATIYPANSARDVESLLHVLPTAIQSIADFEVEIRRIADRSTAQQTPAWPRCCTLRGLLTFCADVKGLPEREDLRALSAFCDLDHRMGKDQKDKLLSLSETSGAALYADYVLREKRSWVDVLYDFDSVELTIESLLTLLPPMRPRHFSIASAPSTCGEPLPKENFNVELCVAVVEGKTPLGRSYHGLCSNYLAGLSEKAMVRMWIKPGSFGKLPLELSDKGQFEIPILCIGAGTGIAPLRSLLLEREAVRKKQCQHSSDSTEDDCKTPDSILIFGCRKESCDYYYRDFWESLVKERHLTLLTAFSRGQWHKIYVQQVLRAADEGKLVEKHILEGGGAIYVAGGAKMARAVKEEVLECLASAIGEKQAALLLKRMNQRGQYNVEAWS